MFVANLAPLGSLQETVTLHDILGEKDAELEKLRNQLKKADALAVICEDAARILNWDDFTEALETYWEVRDAAR